MVILGAGINHWYNSDMIYRGIINILVMCGCIGRSGGGWAHYAGQEKLRPQTGWLPVAFGLDWNRPPRQMNSTSFIYNHSLIFKAHILLRMTIFLVFPFTSLIHIISIPIGYIFRKNTQIVCKRG